MVFGLGLNLAIAERLHALQKFGRTPLCNGPGRGLVVLDLLEIADLLLDSLELGQILLDHVEYMLHVPDKFVDGEIDEGQVAQKPVVLGSGLLDLDEPGIDVGLPLLPLEFLELLLGLLLAVYRYHVVHVGYGPDVHVDDGSVAQRLAQQILRAETVYYIDADRHWVGDKELSLPQKGEQKEVELLGVLVGVFLPFLQREELVLVVGFEVFEQEARDLGLAPEVVVADCYLCGVGGEGGLKG